MQGRHEDVVAARRMASPDARWGSVSPRGAVFDGEVDSVVAPAFDGLVGILPPVTPVQSDQSWGRAS